MVLHFSTVYLEIFLFKIENIRKKMSLIVNHQKNFFYDFHLLLIKQYVCPLAKKCFIIFPTLRRCDWHLVPLLFFISKKRELLARAKSSHKWQLQYCCKYYMSLQIKARQMMAAHQRTT